MGYNRPNHRLVVVIVESAMSHPTKAALFGDLAKAAEMQAKLIEMAEAYSALDAEAARALLVRLATRAGGDVKVNGDGRSRKQREGPTHLDRVCELFVKNGNGPLTKKEIEQRTAMKEWAVHGVIYADNADDYFIRADNPKGGREKVISLIPAVFEAAKRANGELFVKN